jgi:hypothetical protein
LDLLLLLLLLLLLAVPLLVYPLLVPSTSSFTSTICNPLHHVCTLDSRTAFSSQPTWGMGPQPCVGWDLLLLLLLLLAVPLLLLVYPLLVLLGGPLLVPQVQPVHQLLVCLALLLGPEPSLPTQDLRACTAMQ